MKRVIYLTLFCFAFALKGISQNYFSKRIDIAGKESISSTLKLYDDSLFVPVFVFETGNTYSICLLKVTKTGVIFSQKRFKPVNVNYAGGNDLHIKNKKFYISSITDYGNKLRNGLYVFNKDCDTIYTKSYGDTTFYNLGYKIQPYLKTNNKLLLIGLTDSTCGPPHSGKYRPFIKVVDTNGILYQTNLYLSNTKYRTLTKCDTTKHKGYIFSGVEQFGSSVGRNYIVKLDSNLNVSWVQYLLPQTYSFFNGLVSLKDGGNVISHNIIDSSSNNIFWERVGLSKLDANGNLLWEKYYGSKQYDISSYAVKELKNKGLIVCGAQRVTYTPNITQVMGFLMCTDSMGNLKWWNNYIAKYPIKDTIADNYLYDVIEMPDKGFAAVGWAGGSLSPFNNIQQTWLLRVDSMGCLSPGCVPVLTTVQQHLKNEVKIIYYPNPSTGKLFIETTEFLENTEIKLTDVAGKEIRKEKIRSAKTEINIAELENGIYFIEILKEGRIITVQKLIKQ